MKPNRKNPLLAAAISLTLTAPSAFAVDLYWDIDGTTAGSGGATPSGTWATDGTTWSADSTGATDTSTPTITTTSVDNLFFSAGTDATGSYTVTLGANQSARSLTFEEGAATLTDNTLTLTGGGITALAGSGDPIFSSNLTISGGSIFNVGTGRILTLNGTTFTRGTRATLNVRGAGTVTSTMTGLSALTNSIFGPWASIGTGGSTGYATIDGSNNIVGLAGSDTTVDLIVSVPTANYNVSAVGTLGASASVNTLRYTGAAGTVAGGLTTKGIMNVGAGKLVFSGAVTSGAAATELVLNAANADIDLNGIVTGTIVKTGSGTVTLGNVANLSATTPNWTVNEGTLVTRTSTNDGLGGGTINSGGTLRWGGSTDFGNGAVFTINAGGIFDMNGFTDLIGGISGAGTVTNGGATALLQLGDTTRTFSGQIQGPINLVKRTGGDQTLSGENTFTGTTLINNPGTTATLTLANPLALQNSALDTTGTSLGTTGIGLRTTVTTLTLGGLIGNKDLASVFRQDASGGPAGTTALGGYSGVTALTLNPAATVTRTYTAVIADGATGMTLTKTGAGTQVLSGANTYTGGTTLTTGTLQFAKTNSMPATGAVDVGTGATLAVNAGDTANGEFSNATSGAGSIGGLLAGIGGQGAAVSYTGDVRLGIDTTNAVGSVSYAGAIADVGTTLGLTKLGTNTLTLTVTNTYSANTTISAGTLRLENTGAVQNSPLVSVGANTLQLATDTPFSAFPALSSQGGTIVSDRATPGAGLTHALGNATIGNTATTFTAGPNVTSGTAAIQLGNISNNNGSVANPRLNPTTANLIITGGVTLGTGNFGTANLILDGTGSVNSIAGAIVNGTRVSGNVIKTGTSTWTLSGLNTYTGDTTVNDGVLAVTGTSIPDTGKLLINGSGIVNLTGAENVAALDFNGTPQPDGTYSATDVPDGASITTASFSGGGTLEVGVASSGFSAWITQPFENGTVTNQGPNDDDDNDGISNLVEYAIAGQDPTVPNASIGSFNGTLLSFSKRLDATGLTYAIQESTDLGVPDDWDEVTHNPPTNPYVNDASIISYTLTPGTPPKNFLRLQVISN
jgi:autotransporter-associated beta strand protein